MITCMLNAQVTGAKYYLKELPIPNRYEAGIIITSGQTNSAQNRVMGLSPFSLVVPTGSAVNSITSFWPLRDNIAGNGSPSNPSTIPIDWLFGERLINPIPGDSLDYRTIYNNTSPTGFFNTLKAGDTLKLFEFSAVVPSHKCQSMIRQYFNGVDPSGSTPGMGGADFSNSISIGGQIVYQGNQLISPPLRHVFNKQNDGVGTLRKICYCAQNGDEIVLDGLASNDTINLTTHITVNKNLTIKAQNTKVINSIECAFDVLSGKELILEKLHILKKIGNITPIIQNMGFLNLKNTIIKDKGLNTANNVSISNKMSLIFSGNSQILKQ